MTTISTQQVLDYILQQISKDFNIDYTSLSEKYGSLDTISNIIQNNITNSKNTKKKVVRKVTKAVVEEPLLAVTTEPPVTESTPTPKKKVVRKVTKAVVEEPLLAVTEEPPVTESTPTPKKKVVRKVTKAVVEEPLVTVTNEPSSEHLDSVEGSEEKVKPQAKRIVKKVPVMDTVLPEEINEEPKKNSKKNVELVEFDACANANNNDRLEENVYVDTQTYDDEDSDSLEPREVNGVKYYVDSSNYVYHIETQDLIGKLNDKGDKIIFLSDFSGSD